MNIYQTLEPRTLDEIIALGCIMIDNAVEKVILKHEAEISKLITNDKFMGTMVYSGRKVNVFESTFRFFSDDILSSLPYKPLQF